VSRAAKMTLEVSKIARVRFSALCVINPALQGGARRWMAGFVLRSKTNLDRDCSDPRERRICVHERGSPTATVRYPILCAIHRHQETPQPTPLLSLSLSLSLSLQTLSLTQSLPLPDDSISSRANASRTARESSDTHRSNSMARQSRDLRRGTQPSPSWFCPAR
jgi:hypothetical protein